MSNNNKHPIAAPAPADDVSAILDRLHVPALADGTAEPLTLAQRVELLGERSESAMHALSEFGHGKDGAIGVIKCESCGCAIPKGQARQYSDDVYTCPKCTAPAPADDRKLCHVCGLTVVSPDQTVRFPSCECALTIARLKQAPAPVTDAPGILERLGDVLWEARSAYAGQFDVEDIVHHVAHGQGKYAPAPVTVSDEQAELVASHLFASAIFFPHWSKMDDSGRKDATRRVRAALESARGAKP